jgi:hypothetical protein
MLMMNALTISVIAKKKMDGETAPPLAGVAEEAGPPCRAAGAGAGGGACLPQKCHPPPGPWRHIVVHFLPNFVVRGPRMHEKMGVGQHCIGTHGRRAVAAF